MERTQCLYENEVEFNLSESGVLPLRVEEVLQSSKESADFLALGLKYPESDGSEQLRECIALWYGTTADHVLVTNGGAEANFTALWGLLEKGDHAAVMLPTIFRPGGFPAPTRPRRMLFIWWKAARTEKRAGPWTLTVCIEQ
jgi:histidinol-phosphate/aromatic aminotransferase/cobyric acid decarboxylase-like protein